MLRQWVLAITYRESKLMRKILFGLAAVTLVAVGSLAPAKAQTYGYGSGYGQKYGYGSDQKSGYGSGYGQKYGSGYGWPSGYGSSYGYGHQR